MSSAQLSTVQAVAATVGQAVQRQDGDLLAQALRLDMGNSSLLTQLSSSADAFLQQQCTQWLSEPYDEMLLEHFRFLASHARRAFLDAHTHCERAAELCQVFFLSLDPFLPYVRAHSSHISPLNSVFQEHLFALLRR